MSKLKVLTVLLLCVGLVGCKNKEDVKNITAPTPSVVETEEKVEEKEEVVDEIIEEEIVEEEAEEEIEEENVTDVDEETIKADIKVIEETLKKPWGATAPFDTEGNTGVYFEHNNNFNIMAVFSNELVDTYALADDYIYNIQAYGEEEHTESYSKADESVLHFYLDKPTDLEYFEAITSEEGEIIFRKYRGTVQTIIKDDGSNNKDYVYYYIDEDNALYGMEIPFNLEFNVTIPKKEVEVLSFDAEMGDTDTTETVEEETDEPLTVFAILETDLAFGDEVDFHNLQDKETVVEKTPTEIATTYITTLLSVLFYMAVQ